MSDYTNSSISTLKGADQVRKKPAVIFGTEDINGCANAIFEIISNSIDEAREGYGKRIDITIDTNNSIKVQDYGRGVPMDYNKSEDRFNWELVYCTLYASGKYDDTNYKTSLGLNGLGCTATQYASEFMTVTSMRDGYRYTKDFKKGEPIGELQKTALTDNNQTGTVVTFRPDIDVFTDIDVPFEFYDIQLRRQAILHDGLEFNLNYKGKTKQYLYTTGAVGYLQESCHRAITKTPVQFKGQTECQNHKGNYTLEMMVAITFSREENSLSEVYHNGGYLADGGVTDQALLTSMCKAINEYGRTEGLLGKTDSIEPKHLDGVVHYIGSTGCPGSMTEFKNQTKTAITNKEIKEAYKTFVYQNIIKWLQVHKEETKKIVTEVLINKKAYDSADAIKKQAIKKLTQSIENPRTQPEKFVDCKNHKKGNAELWIVEGDSALGSCMLARDAEFQAIIPVRGKIINCLKNSLSEVLKSGIIIDLIRVLGCGIEARTKQVKDLPEFDITKLRWDKVIICTDADIDGMHIRCLLIAMFYKLIPSLLGQNKVFIAETPLFEITANKDTYFAYSDEERDKIIASLKDTKYKVMRSKGLGENNPEMMWGSTMCPDTRKLVSLETQENDTELNKLFDSLLGDDIIGRKEIVNHHFDIEIDAE